LAFISVIGLMLIFLKAPAECHGFEIGIDVAPNMPNIQTDGQVVTVHPSIAYSDADHDNVYLNGKEMSSWKADSRGYFVAKFLISEVRALADGGD
jgi:hypothetical protein